MPHVGRHDEASRPGPMSLTIGDDGTLYLLDQVNHRVLRFARDGRPLGKVATIPETTEDIVVAGSTLYALVYQRKLSPGAAGPGFYLERHTLDDSRPSERINLSRSLQLPTGLFVSGSPATPDVWIETRHDRATRVVRAGSPLVVGEQAHQVLGRPQRTRALTQLTARRIDRHTAKVARVDARDATPILEVHTPTNLLGIHALTSDALGRVYLGLLLKGAHGKSARRILLVADTEAIHLLELSDDHITDSFRRLAVGADGTVYHLTSTKRGIEIHRFTAEQIAHAVTIPAGGVS